MNHSLFDLVNFEQRHVDWYEDDNGMTVLNARLPRSEGEVVVKALAGCLFSLDNDNEKPDLAAALEDDVSAETDA